MSATRYRIFITVAPGLEALLEQELLHLGILDQTAGEAGRGTRGTSATRLTGGLELAGDRRSLWTVACCSRVAETVRVRVGSPFVATSFEDLRQGLLRLPWAAYLRRGGSLPRVRVTCHRSRLYHSGAVAQRVEQVLAQRLGDEAGDETEGQVYLRLERNRVQVSIDASGDPLHRRGYRLQVGQAPLRETLAAACLQAAGYAGGPLWDPFCGSGTLPIEALAMAAGILPGTHRHFAFERWPTHAPDEYGRWAASLPAPGDASAQVFGSDRDPLALKAAAANARTAELDACLTLVEGDFEQVAARIPAGTMIVSNPPYGHRVPAQRDLYQRFGQLLGRTDMGPVYVLTAMRGFGRATGLKWEPTLEFSNQGLRVRLLHLSL